MTRRASQPGGSAAAGAATLGSSSVNFTAGDYLWDKAAAAVWQRDLSILQGRIGNVLFAQDNLPGALEAYRAMRAIRERLGKADPGNADWQRDLALGHGRVAMVLARQGAQDAARSAFGQGQAIITRLKILSPDNAILPEDLAWFESQISALDKP